MNIKYCRTCGTPVSRIASRCVVCGGDKFETQKERDRRIDKALEMNDNKERAALSERRNPK